MTIKCPQCGYDNPAETVYCGKCGAKLEPSGPMRPSGPTPEKESIPKDSGQMGMSGSTAGKESASRDSSSKDLEGSMGSKGKRGQEPKIDDVSVSHTKTLETPREELTTGSTFAGRYQIIEELGKGGMGRVYNAIDKEIEAKVALKLIKPEIAATKKTIERFRNELKMARQISHKNVCRMYHLGNHEGTHYITMEYVPGEDLKSFIRRSRQLTVGTAISIAKQVCEGLAEAHRLGVVHRDLKPQNVMIDRDGNAKIMDFGIARSLKGKGITAAGVMIGTPEYMSPEQVEGKEVDQRSDIYSLGIILYEMVTGRVPFEGETPLSVAVKHKTERAKDPQQFNSQIPEALSRIILKCMAKDKESRHQSAEHLREIILRGYLCQRLLHAGPNSGGAGCQRKSHRAVSEILISLERG